MNGTIEQLQPGGTTTNPTDSRTDEQLLLEYRETGDREAFDRLVHRYERELYGYLRRYLGDADMAEDVFQRTFLQVHLKCDKFDADRKVRPWLYTVATNQAIDHQRRNRRHRMVSLDRHNGVNPEDENGSLAQLLDSAEPDPFEQAELAERGARLRAAVDQLPPLAREVVLLVYFQGLKYREAAEVMSIPVGTVKSRLHAAISKLGEAINPDGALSNEYV
jgi:RNA polymerase sigma-70 factor (ECF subfamily)